MFVMQHVYDFDPPVCETIRELISRTEDLQLQINVLTNELSVYRTQLKIADQRIANLESVSSQTIKMLDDTKLLYSQRQTFV